MSLITPFNAREQGRTEEKKRWMMVACLKETAKFEGIPAG
jgi:hypothetical protein